LEFLNVDEAPVLSLVVVMIARLMGATGEVM